MTDDKRVEEVKDWLTECIKTTLWKKFKNVSNDLKDEWIEDAAQAIRPEIVKLVDEAEKKARVEEMIRMSKTKNFKQFAISRLAELEGK